MIRKLFNKLFGEKKKYKIDSVSKKRLIEWIQVYMNMNRGSVYANIDKNVSFKDFSKITKKKWENVLRAAFSSDLMNDSEIGIKQQITSDIFNYYYKGLFHEIRNISYNIIDNTFKADELIKYSGNLMELYKIIVTNHSKRFKVLQNIDKYGENVIMGELKVVVEKLLKKKLAKMN